MFPFPDFRGVPFLSRRTYALELWGTFFFSCAIATIEGGLIGVFLKQTYAGAAPERTHNLLVALAGAAGELANIISFSWIAASLGRPKVRFINGLQVATILSIASIAFMPRTQTGLFATVLVVILARVCWSGIVTLRSAVWRANYPRTHRARIVGRFAIITQLLVAVIGVGFGAAMDVDQDAFTYLIPLACALGLIGSWFYGKVRFRGERASLRDELRPSADGRARPMPPWLGVVAVVQVLRRDPRFMQFMVCMFVLGLGNLMTMPVLIVALKDDFGLEYTASILITTTIPNLIMPPAVLLWARLLDRSHVVKFRSIHSWSFVAATALYALAAATHSLPLMYAGSVALGIGLGGGALAWNLGHTDFSPPSLTSHYMATHVTLNGVRGLMAPFLAIGLYEALRGGTPAGQGSGAATVVLVVCMVFSIAGAVGFGLLRSSMGVAGTTIRRDS